MDSKQFEFRVSWSSGVVGGEGASDWMPWEGADERTEDEVRAALNEGGGISQALDIALQHSGFDFWVDIREA